ncbi:hypothetical protein TPAR_02839, partial [Tolypocladium paradoxum]
MHLAGRRRDCGQRIQRKADFSMYAALKTPRQSMDVDVAEIVYRGNGWLALVQFGPKMVRGIEIDSSIRQQLSRTGLVFVGLWWHLRHRLLSCGSSQRSGLPAIALAHGHATSSVVRRRRHRKVVGCGGIHSAREAVPVVSGNNVWLRLLWLRCREPIHGRLARFHGRLLLHMGRLSRLHLSLVHLLPRLQLLLRRALVCHVRILLHHPLFLLRHPDVLELLQVALIHLLQHRSNGRNMHRKSQTLGNVRPSVCRRHRFIATSGLDDLEQHDEIDRSVTNDRIMVQRQPLSIHQRGEVLHEVLRVYVGHRPRLRSHAALGYLAVWHAGHLLLGHHPPSHVLRLHLRLHLHVALQLLLKSHLVRGHLLLVRHALRPLVLLLRLALVLRLALLLRVLLLLLVMLLLHLLLHLLVHVGWHLPHVRRHLAHLLRHHLAAGHRVRVGRRTRIRRRRRKCRVIAGGHVLHVRVRLGSAMLGRYGRGLRGAAKLLSAGRERVRRGRRYSL